MDNPKVNEMKEEKFAYEMPEIVDITMPEVLGGPTGEQTRGEPTIEDE